MFGPPCEPQSGDPALQPLAKHRRGDAGVGTISVQCRVNGGHVVRTQRSQGFRGGRSQVAEDRSAFGIVPRRSQIRNLQRLLPATRPLSTSETQIALAESLPVRRRLLASLPLPYLSFITHHTCNAHQNGILKLILTML